MGVSSPIEDMLNLVETQAIWRVKAQYVPWGIIENNVLNLEETQAIWRVKLIESRWRWRRGWSCWGIIAVLAGEYCRGAGDPSRCVLPVWDAVPNWAADSSVTCYKPMRGAWSRGMVSQVLTPGQVCPVTCMVHVTSMGHAHRHHWFGGVMVSMLTCGTGGPGFESQGKPSKLIFDENVQ